MLMLMQKFIISRWSELTKPVLIIFVITQQKPLNVLNTIKSASLDQFQSNLYFPS